MIEVGIKTFVKYFMRKIFYEENILGSNMLNLFFG